MLFLIILISSYFNITATYETLFLFLWQSLQERVKLFEDVKVQQERLRQRLWERRQLMDDRVKDVCQAEETSKSQRRESPEQTLPRPAVQSLAEPGGYVPREGTRQAEAQPVEPSLKLVRSTGSYCGTRQKWPPSCVSSRSKRQFEEKISS